MKEVADGLRESGNFGTAHIYRSSLSAILAFHGSDKLPFRKVSQDRHLAPYVPHHFRYVYTGTRADRKRALDKEDMERLMKELPKQLCQDNKELQRTRGLFFLMFLLRGIPFVDLAYLKKHDIDGNVMTYRRRKTGRLLTVTLVPEAMKLIKRYMNTDPASPYLFSLITSGEGTEAAYKEYQLALRNFNYQLMILKQVLGLTSEVSSYTARHT